LGAQPSAELPNFASLNGPSLLEAGRFPASSRHELEKRGHVLTETPLNSGVHLLLRSAEGWDAGVDPRREGAAAGR
jgi:gamma-glutamyltranspeptidase/glutathione hydrolase